MGIGASGASWAADLFGGWAPVVHGGTGGDLGEQHRKCGGLEKGVLQERWPEGNTG